MSISRVEEPSSEGPKVPFLRRVNTAGESYEAIALAAAVFWVYTHFDLAKHRTHACTATRSLKGLLIDPADCPACQAKVSSRIRGYLHVWAIKSRREEFLEITPVSWQHIRLAWPALPTLRGWRVTASRGRGKTSPLSIFLAEPSLAQDLAKLPKEKNPEETLAMVMK